MTTPNPASQTMAERTADLVPAWIVNRIGLHHRHMPYFLLRWLTLRRKDDALAVGVDYAR